MDPLSYLDNMLSDFSSVFKHNNFAHFETIVQGLIKTPDSGTLTQLYENGAQSTTYWVLPKFLSRGTWCVDEVTSVLTRRVQTSFSEGVYVYDETHKTHSGVEQYGGSFFKNTGYNKRKKNQSKFHHGHQFGAIGWLCKTDRGTTLFPLGIRLMCPQKKRDNSLSVFKRLSAQMPPGLIIFDRGFNRRAIFTDLLSKGHHLLCRAKSNAVFYHIPTASKHRGRGRPARYGNPVHLPWLNYRDTVVGGQTLSVADKIVRTKMCPGDVRLIVIRTRKKRSKPYHYFCLFTSDLKRPVPELIQHYKDRWQIETAFRDVKQNFGLGTYQLKTRKGLNRFAQLCFVAATLTQLVFIGAAADTQGDTDSEAMDLSVEDVLLELNKHWYKATYLTRGLMAAYLQLLFQKRYFSASTAAQQNSQKNRKISENST